MLVNAVFDKEISHFTKRLIHDVEASSVVRENPGRKVECGVLKDPFREKYSVDGRIIKKRSEQRGKSDFWLLDSSKTGHAASKVDKKRDKCLIFVYRRLQNRSARP